MTSETQVTANIHLRPGTALPELCIEGDSCWLWVDKSSIGTAAIFFRSPAHARAWLESGLRQLRDEERERCGVANEIAGDLRAEEASRG